MATQKKRALGKGLEALLGSTKVATAVPVSSLEQQPIAAVVAKPVDGDMHMLAIEMIKRSPFQPRIDFDPQRLEELAVSIRSQGIIQPIVVRPLLIEGEFELIAGERRWRAAQLAGLHELPAIIREVPDQTAMALALIENIQREELNPMEEARALHRLIEEFGLTHQNISNVVGRSRTAVTNLLRLLALESAVITLLENGDLEMGHARALLAVKGDTQSQLARVVIDKALSVRETERLVRQTLEQMENPQKEIPKSTIDPDVRNLQESIGSILGAKVLIKQGKKGSGQMVIHYSSLDELDGIIKHIQ